MKVRSCHTIQLPLRYRMGHVPKEEEKDDEDDSSSASESGSSLSIPDEIEETPEVYAKSCLPCNFFASRNVRHIRSLNEKFKKKAAPVLTQMEWRTFPLEEELRSKGQNYLVCKTWILTYALFEVKEIENQVRLKESPIAELFADLVGAAELMGAELGGYSSALLKLKTRYKNAANYRINQLNIRDGFPPNVVKLRYDLDPALIFGGKMEKKEDYALIRAGLRDLQAREWSSFQDRKDGFYLISAGLRELITDCTNITKGLKKLCKLFQSATRWGSIDSVRSTINWIRKFNIRAEKGTRSTEHESLLYDEAVDLFQHLIYYGDLIGLEAMKLLLMIRLCYTFIKEGNFDHVFCINLESYNKVLQKRCAEQLDNLLPWTNFNENDWYQVACPHALRRVPVLISDKYELGLYNEDFQKEKRRLSKIQKTDKAMMIMKRIREDAERMRKENTTGSKSKFHSRSRSRNTKFSFNLRRLAGTRGSRPHNPNSHKLLTARSTHSSKLL